MEVLDAQNILIDYTKPHGVFSKPEKVMIAVDVLINNEAALREELAVLRAYNSALVSAKTAFIDSEQWEGEAGYLRPDNAEEMLNAAFNKTPAQSLAKVRADAVRDMLNCIDGAIENDFISMREVDEMTLEDFFTLANKHADKIGAAQ